MTTETLTIFEKDNYEIAEAIAPTWERRREEVEKACASVRNWMLNELAPQDGDTVLELAAGTGDTGFEAAEALGERGRLITTDLSPAMVDAARRRGEELGLSNVSYEVMDAERLTLETDSVDGVALPLRVHADAELRRGARRDAACPATGWACRARELGPSRAQPVLLVDRNEPRSAWSHPAARAAARPRSVQHGHSRSAPPPCWKAPASPTSAPRRCPFASPRPTWTDT